MLLVPLDGAHAGLPRDYPFHIGRDLVRDGRACTPEAYAQREQQLPTVVPNPAPRTTPVTKRGRRA